MKRIGMIVLCLVLIAAITACGQPADTASDADGAPMNTPTQATDEPATEPEAEPTPVPTAESAHKTPMDLVGEVFNPFFTVEFPEYCTVYQAAFESSEHELYRLYMTAEGTAEDIVTYFSELVGDGAPESIAQNLDALNDGGVSIPGTQTDDGLSADISIEPTDPEEGRYAYVDGYVVCLTMGVGDMTDVYHDMVDLNMATAAYEEYGVADFFANAVPTWREIKLTSKLSAVQMECWYDLSADYDTWKETFETSAIAEYLHGDNDDIIDFDYGNLSVHINLNDDEKVIFVSQWMNRTDINAAEYVPTPSLGMLGFRDFVEDDGECNIDDEEQNVYVRISKIEWGAECDCITMYDNNFDGDYSITYYPAEGKYEIWLANDEKGAPYCYFAADNHIEPNDEGWDEHGITENMKALTGLDDDAEALAAPVIFFDTYFADSFSMTADELFTLPAN